MIIRVAYEDFILLDQPLLALAQAQLLAKFCGAARSATANRARFGLVEVEADHSLRNALVPLQHPSRLSQQPLGQRHLAYQHSPGAFQHTSP